MGRGGGEGLFFLAGDGFFDFGGHGFWGCWGCCGSVGVVVVVVVWEWEWVGRLMTDEVPSFEVGTFGSHSVNFSKA